MAKQKTYKDKKEWIRSQAIEWKANCSKHSYSYGTLNEMETIFTKLGTQYGLLKEFRANGII